MALRSGEDVGNCRMLSMVDPTLFSVAFRSMRALTLNRLRPGIMNVY